MSGSARLDTNEGPASAPTLLLDVDLDGYEDPHEQHTGIDLLLPYWAARNHATIAR